MEVTTTIADLPVNEFLTHIENRVREEPLAQRDLLRIEARGHVDWLDRVLRRRVPG